MFFTFKIILHTLRYLFLKLSLFFFIVFFLLLYYFFQLQPFGCKSVFLISTIWFIWNSLFQYVCFQKRINEISPEFCSVRVLHK